MQGHGHPLSAGALVQQETTMKASQPQQSRRRLFAGAGTVAAVAAVASVLPVRQEPAAVHSQAEPEKGPGYRLTEHVQRYYQTTRV
jgi:hypothetical protein